MSLPRQLFANGTLARPLRGDVESWEYIGASATPRTSFDPYARRARPRRQSLRVTAGGWRILLNVLRAR
jgi:hypothetical protein